ncbi:RND superfamily putative drug exporter [Paenibacillus sp. V4I3]|uniref:MMPL family transporter n=1 Tax=Paenibacillus sp. V4I3 TaxID=3042305 RepID=UPI00278AB8C7|nr:MMPL family transporter [Paenibacillus sp. V4I3]MDQ0872375.1 RND superfamily putative drug exporter [Paenibacillus sp. V4I3]
MNKIIKWRWTIVALWLVATVVLTVFQPDVNAILGLRGQDPLPKDSPSKVATSILNKMNGVEGTSDIIVFHNPNKLSDADMKQIESGIASMKDHQAELGFDQLLDPFSLPDAKSSLISEDQTTLMANFSLDKRGRHVDEIQQEFEAVLKEVNVDYYLSGEDFIQNDYIKASESGVAKSAALTVIFILAVLVIMFRSVVIPIVSLLAVGISYLCSMGIAAQLIDKFEFPVTSVTEMLLILILFGIGTDYNILLFNRFKEELSHGLSVDEAIIVTYKTAGKTIFYSILTVFIAFASLTFSDFGIYKSGNVVAIGTAVLLLEIMTVTPFLMKVLGNKLYWPSKCATGHKESKFWASLTAIAVKRPVITTLLILIVMIPIALSNHQKLSFDQLKELGNDHESTKGFSLVADHFSRGQALPTMVVIENEKALGNNDGLAAIDKLTDKLKSVPGVDKVSSVTQPQSKPIDNFYISTQTSTVAEGITASQKGVNQIQDGLQLMQSKLVSPDLSGTDQLVAGTGKVQDGYSQITVALGQVSKGIAQGADGAGELTAGIASLKDGMMQVDANTSKFSSGLTQLQQGYSALSDGYRQIEGKLPGIQQGLTGMNGLIGGLGEKYSQLKADADYTKLKQTGEGLETGLAQLNGGLKELGANAAKLNGSFVEAAAGLTQINGAQAQLAAGLASLQSGSEALAKGLKQGSAGSQEIATNMAKLNDALGSVKDGQQKLNEGLSGLAGGMSQLKEGLGQSGNGLGDVSEGLGKTSQFLTQLNSSKTFFIPKEALTSADFGKSLDSFMSKDRKSTKLIVILKDDPYSSAAMDTIEGINAELASSLKGTVLEKAKVGAAGPSSTTYDTNKAQLKSFNSTAIIVIIGVFIVLLFVIRSFWPAVYIIVSLVISYYVAMTATNIVTDKIIGADGVSSFVPFFSFIIIIAVGVDYSIFLMMRYKELGELSPSKAIVQAAKHIGGVVISAMVILGGTFATLVPSGLVLLIELAVAVIVGLVVLCFILLPMLLPALLAIPEALRMKPKSEARQVSTESRTA